MLLRKDPSELDNRRTEVATRQATEPPLSEASAARPSLVKGFPLATEGMHIGLLGGSFNPPHLAHRAISLFAIKRLRLDRGWGVGAPGHPPKGKRPLH